MSKDSSHALNTDDDKAKDTSLLVTDNKDRWYCLSCPAAILYCKRDARCFHCGQIQTPLPPGAVNHLIYETKQGKREFKLGQEISFKPSAPIEKRFPGEHCIFRILQLINDGEESLVWLYILSRETGKSLINNTEEQKPPLSEIALIRDIRLD